ncbi:MAG TPA: hypothetical protein VJM49_06590 [Acidimicrobiales bacterium]|nr:hypothetical protein [Acidimicrobiales bacterium]
MQIPMRFHAGLADGSITLAFRRWRRPAAKAGGRQRTPIGELAIDAVEAVEAADVTDADARSAGYRDRGELLGELDRFGPADGTIYRIALHLAGPDPRVALRERAEVTDDEWAQITARLERLDRLSRHGPWTATVLRLIAERPAVRAPDLAASLGRETQPFKTDVRKLKELGLTESLEVGYRLSPRGRTVLARLDGAP